jgi:hypothetical protein
MGSTAKGLLALVLEPTAAPGRQTLLPETAVAATMSLTTQPNAILSGTLMYLHVVVKGATASGTVALAGKKADGTTAVSETSTTLAAATATQPNSEYCTVATYNTVNASGITTTGLTGATITVYGIYAATKLVPANFNVVEKFDQFSANDHRGILWKDIRVQQLNKHVSLDKFDQALYPDTSLWWAFCNFGSTPTTTLIASAGSTPDVLKAITAVSGSPLSLTTQPLAPGQLLQFVVTSAAASGTIAISGTNQYGVATTETVAASGNGTFYSQNVYSAVASGGITVTGLTSGSVAIGGFFATKWTFTMPADPISTIACAIFTGTDSAVYPFGIIDSGDFSMDVDKEIGVTCKTMTQDRVAIGNRATNPQTANLLPVYGQPIDYPAAGWATLVYIDAISGTPGTTLYPDLLDVKLSIDTGAKTTYTAANTQVYSRFYREPASMKFDATVDFLNQIEYENFRQLQKRLFVFKFQESNRFVGSSSSSPVFKYWQFTVPAKYQAFDLDRSKEKVTAKMSGVAEYSESLGYAVRLDVVNQMPPTYASL